MTGRLWLPKAPAIIRERTIDRHVCNMLLVNQLNGFGVGGGAASYQTPSYANTGGTGNRTASITMSTDITTQSGNIVNLVNGSTTLDGSNAWIPTTQAWTGNYIRIDLGSAALITAMKFTHQTPSHNHGTARFGGSNDASNWTYYGSAVTIVSDLGPTEYTELSTNVTGYRYYQIEGVTGNANGNTWLGEWEFKIGWPV